MYMGRTLGLMDMSYKFGSMQWRINVVPGGVIALIESLPFCRLPVAWVGYYSPLVHYTSAHRHQAPSLHFS